MVPSEAHTERSTVLFERHRAHVEEPIEIQAFSVDLRGAVMARLCGGESRRWTIAELVERFRNLGVCASRASVTAALVELGLELELSSWAPWRLLERGTEWILAPKSELVELLSGVCNVGPTCL